jgi:hypothetical protein
MERPSGHQLSSPVAILSRAELGESPIWPTLAVLTAAGLYATLPTRFIAGHSTTGVFGAARWIVPVLTLLLLVPLVLTVPKQSLLESARLRTHALRLTVTRRVASLAVIALVTVANATSITLLVHSLIVGEHAQARQLLRVAIHLWTMNVLIFGLWFWQLDGGGPIGRRIGQTVTRDFLFPQQSLGETGAGWQPNFIDYLFVSYTNATAFSPTDTMPLSQWAKLLMIAQSAASLLLAIMVAARAVNILQ